MYVCVGHTRPKCRLDWCDSSTAAHVPPGPLLGAGLAQQPLFRRHPKGSRHKQRPNAHSHTRGTSGRRETLLDVDSSISDYWVNIVLKCGADDAGGQAKTLYINTSTTDRKQKRISTKKAALLKLNTWKKKKLFTGFSLFQNSGKYSNWRRVAGCSVLSRLCLTMCCEQTCNLGRPNRPFVRVGR